MSKTREHRYKELRLGQLRSFCACVRHGSFSAAARALKLAQPSVWQQVRALEREFGVTLLEKRGDDLVPSEDGQVLLEMATGLLASMDSIHEAFEDRRRGVSRALRVGGTPSTIVEDLNLPITAFCRAHPEVCLSLTYCSNQTDTLDMVIAGDLDLAAQPFHRQRFADRDRFLVREPLHVRRLALILPTAHPLTRKRKIQLADVVRYPLLLPRVTNTGRQTFEESLRAAGLLPQLHILMEADNNFVIRRCVGRGLGLGIVNLPLDPMEFADTCTRSPEWLGAGEQIELVWRRGSAPRPQARAFAQFVREHVAAHTDATGRDGPG
jgi:DNA-binding transcriptional LysR family regulator